MLGLRDVLEGFILRTKVFSGQFVEIHVVVPVLGRNCTVANAKSATLSAADPLVRPAPQPHKVIALFLADCERGAAPLPKSKS